MANIAEIRQQYPQYSDLSDEQLAQGLHKKYYSDLPFEDFSARIGLQSGAPQAPQQQPADPTAGDRANAVAAGFNRGVAGLAGLPVDTIQNIIDLGKALSGTVYRETTGNDIPQALTVNSDRSGMVGSGAYFQKMLGAAGEVPREDLTSQRLLAAGGQGASAALTGPAVGARVIPSMVGGIAGAESAAIAGEAGAGPTGQLAAGLAGSMLVPAAPRVAAEGIKRALRGGEQGRLRTAQNVQDFEASGTRPTIGQATEGRLARSAESLMSRTPGSAGVITRRATQQADELGANLERRATSLAPQATSEQAGRAITQGVRGDGGFVDKFKAKQSQLYDELDRYVKPQAPVDLSKTTSALAKLNADIRGAENTSKFFQNSKMKGIESALSKDLEASAPSPVIAELENVMASGGALPYEAVKKLRTLVGNEMADNSILSDVPRSKWKALYGALSEDLQGAAKASGPQATQAWNRANNYTRAGMRRLETIDHVIEKSGGPEAVFRAATSGTKEGATTLRAVMQSLPQDAQKTVSATVLRRLGKAKPGAQNDTGDTFSTETFLTNWNGMAPEAKAVLFNRYGAGFRVDMDRIARVASNLREGSQVFRNPSGTAQASTQTATATGFVVAAVTGHVGTAAGIASGVVSANLAARLFTNPQVVHWLAKGYRAPVSAIPALLAQLEKIDDPDAQELAALVKERYEQQNNAAAQTAQREREPQ
jgi:hypothetical protein